MANTNFRLPKATRELPAGSVNSTEAANFVKGASVRTTTFEDGVTRKMVSTQVSVELIHAMDVIAKQTRINKRILYEEAISDFVEKHKELL